MDDKSHERSGSSPNVNGEPALEQLQAYNADSAYARAALECVTIYKQQKSCMVSDIAPLGYGNDQDVSVDDIAARLVVSHDWMGDVFTAALREMPQEMLNLFRSVNAVVLSFDIRPSFYHSGTASLYIDPRYLWQSAGQWQDIYQQDDYRESFQLDRFSSSQPSAIWMSMGNMCWRAIPMTRIITSVEAWGRSLEGSTVCWPMNWPMPMTFCRLILWRLSIAA